MQPLRSGHDARALALLRVGRLGQGAEERSGAAPPQGAAPGSSAEDRRRFEKIGSAAPTILELRAGTAPEPGDVVAQLEHLAQRLRPEMIDTSEAKLLGAGLYGATYDLGNGFVAKHLGDPRSTMALVADQIAGGASNFVLAARRQVMVHEACIQDGFACVPARILEADPTWLVMKKADGLRASALSPEELEAGQALTRSLRGQIQASVNRALNLLASQTEGATEEKLDLIPDLNVSNASFRRGPRGLELAEFYDPTI